MRSDEFDWKEACIQREEQHKLWSQVNDNMEYFNYKEGLFASVDGVHLMKVGYGLLGLSLKPISLQKTAFPRSHLCLSLLCHFSDIFQCHHLKLGSCNPILSH